MFKRTCQHQGCDKKATHGKYCAKHAMGALLGMTRKVIKRPKKKKPKIEKEFQEMPESKDYNKFLEEMKKQLMRFTGQSANIYKK
jgi:hypothetical protein